MGKLSISMAMASIGNCKKLPEGICWWDINLFYISANQWKMNCDRSTSTDKWSSYGAVCWPRVIPEWQSFDINGLLCLIHIGVFFCCNFYYNQRKFRCLNSVVRTLKNGIYMYVYTYIYIYIYYIYMHIS